MIDTPHAPHPMYLGHIVTSFTVAFFPFLADMDGLNDGWQRLFFALCGGAGAALAMITDRPKNAKEAVVRCAGGVFASLLFGLYIASKMGQTEVNGVLTVCGVTGLVSYYVLGSVSRLLVEARDGNWLTAIARMKLGITATSTDTKGNTTTVTIEPTKPGETPKPTPSPILLPNDLTTGLSPPK